MKKQTMNKRLLTLLYFFVICQIPLEAKLPDLNPQKARIITENIMQMHASEKTMTPKLMRVVLVNYIELLDPMKTYFTQPQIVKWTDPSNELIDKAVKDFNNGKYTVFEEIFDALVIAVEERQEINDDIANTELPEKVDADEFKEMKWAGSKEELKERLLKIRGLQVSTAAKLNEELKEKSMQRILKRQDKVEQDVLNPDPEYRQKLILADMLKAFASSLDTHTVYFTPDEASQFMINVQQRLFGIGAQLRDDLNGFTVIKTVEGGPAELGGELKNKDRIIAVDGEPVVGMDIVDAVELIRGEENTPVALTVIRDNENGKEENLNITVIRGEVVLKEARIESSYEPFGDGIIAYIHLYTFYQDEENSSATDIANELSKLQAEHNVKGVILDLRYNSGGLLSQAVQVTGLFITKGIVVSIKDNDGTVQHLRDLNGKMIWDGPLIVLVNRASASAAEIVAQTLQDYGRALVVGDDHTFGKGSFQSFTLNSQTGQISPEGEYKVTRGRYYTVSGKTPQLTGVISDVVLPGPLSYFDVGEQYAKHPLANDRIKENFDDDLSDIPINQRDKVKMLYRFALQPKLEIYSPYLEQLKRNSDYRIKNNKNYQAFLEELKDKSPDDEAEEKREFGQNDLQLTEANNVMKDLVSMGENDQGSKTKKKNNSFIGSPSL